MRAATRSLLCCLAAMLPAARADEIDDYLRRQMERQQIPGLSLAVVKDGKVIKAAGYGLANIETKTSATPETVYQLASVTKPFTATAIMLLVQDGKLALDDPIGKYIEGAPESWDGITVRHLLLHTGGIKDYLNELHEGTREDTNPEKIVGLVKGLPLNFSPGERHSYSNTGYVLLAMIVHKASGKPYDLFLRERVFGPLGMNATRRDDPADIIPNRAARYVRDGKGWKNAPDLNPTLWNNGDGGLLSTALDLAKWDEALRGDGLLRAETKRQMWAAGTANDGKSFDYGFGWGLDRPRGHRLIWHSGGRPGTSAIVARFADDGIAVILLANGSGPGMNMGRIALGTARRYIPSLGLPGWDEAGESGDRPDDYAGRYESANNRMLTLAREGGRLADRAPGSAGGYWLPGSGGAFYSEDFPVAISLDRDDRGVAIGLVWKTESGEKRMPRIGPLVRDLAPVPDPDAGLTGRIEAILRAFARGGEGVATAEGIAPGARKDFAGGAGGLAGFRSIAFIAEDDVSGRGIVRHEGEVARIRYYKLSTGRAGGTAVVMVHLTSENLVTDVDVVDE